MKGYKITYKNPQHFYTITWKIRKLIQKTLPFTQKYSVTNLTKMLHDKIFSGEIQNKNLLTPERDPVTD